MQALCRNDNVAQYTSWWIQVDREQVTSRATPRTVLRWPVTSRLGPISLSLAARSGLIFSARRSPASSSLQVTYEHRSIAV